MHRIPNSEPIEAMIKKFTKENYVSNLLCALDRIFDDTIVFKLSGQSHHGRSLETVSLTTSGSKQSISSETSTIN